MSCRSCGGTAFAWEGYSSHGDDSQRVCTNCGVVIEDGCLVADSLMQTANSNEFRSYGRSLPSKFVNRNHQDRPPLGKKQGWSKVKQLAQHLGITQLMQSEVYELFEKVYTSKKFINVRIEKKILLAGCCIAIVCRQHDWPITGVHMSGILACEVTTFQALMREVIQEFNIVLPEFDADKYIESVCKSAKLDDTIVDKMQKILPLFRETWITDGRRLDAVVNGICYLVWQGQDFYIRRHVSPQKFHKEHDIKLTSATKTRIQEMRNILQKLARKLPWVNAESVTNMTASQYINDVITFQKSLLLEFRATLGKEMDNMEETDIEAADSRAGGSTHKATSGDCQQGTSCSDMQEETSKPTSPINTNCDNQCLSECGNQKAIKRSAAPCEEDFQPPSWKKARTRSRDSITSPERPQEIDPNMDLDCIHLTNKDIPEEEMCKYIKNYPVTNNLNKDCDYAVFEHADIDTNT